jgi:Undecaprenyl-phosphate galactose phosphotransferase WbaP
MVENYSRFVPHLLVLSDCSTLPMLWSATRNGGRLSGIEVRNGLLLATLQAFKRAFDVVVALIGLMAGLPVMLLLAALVKLSGPGPVFYLHTRVGRRGRPFKACKFRTMRVNGDEILREHLAGFAAARAEWESARKLRRDPRVTAVGRFLRVTSLDELPQLWNVLKGEMSLVGPRPIVESEIAYYGKVFKLYTTAKPGITGLWQVSGRNDVGYDERVKLDEFYVRHWSPWLDVYILAKTIAALLQRRGAY